MRPLLILASAALILAQGILPASAVLECAKPKCDRCACGGGCCVRKGAPTPTPLSSAPAPTFSVKPWFWAAGTATQPFAPPAPSAGKFFDSLSFHSDRLPLYERNCTLLI